MLLRKFMSSNRGEGGIMPLVVMAAVAIGLFVFIAYTQESPFASFGGIGGTSSAPQVQTFKKIMNARPSGAVKTGFSFDSPAVEDDPFKTNDSPFDYNIVMASSKDGISFSGDKLVIEHALPESAIRQSSGRILVYGRDGARRGLSGIVVAATDNDGKFWKRGSVRIDSNTNSVFNDLEAVLISNIKVRMYYVGDAAANDPKNIYSAISSDGINFVDEPGIRYTDMNISDPDVIFTDNMWIMHVKKDVQIINLISEDGLNFQYDSDMHPASDPITVVNGNNGLFRLFYCYNGIKTAITDGINWEDEGSIQSPLSTTNGCNFDITRSYKSWELFYPKPR